MVELKISKKASLQYILLYLMLLIPGSCAVAKYLNEAMVYYIILALYGILFLLNKKFRSTYVLISVFVLLIITIFVRLKTDGGVGIVSWLRYASIIAITYMAVACDKENFLMRFIKIEVFFAAISLAFWAVFCIFPNLVDLWPATTYWTQDMGTAEWAISYHGKGLWLYSYLEVHPTRNCGIYTEPGVHQIILNAVLFVLLFWSDKLSFKNSKQYRLYLFIILLALLSCQSTTGYIGMLIILLSFFANMASKTVDSALLRKGRKFITAILVVAIFITIINYIAEGTNSIFYQQVIYKLFGDGSTGGIDLSQGTGRAIIGTILVSLLAISQDPFGIGYTQFEIMKNTFGHALVAASITSYAAVYGVIPWILTMYIIFKPVLRYGTKIISVVFVLIFVNTTLAQTYLLYPGLMIIPIYLSVMKRE